ncbi:MAG: acetyl ornithine aminotransferase family protein [Thermoplasmata archaeon]
MTKAPDIRTTPPGPKAKRIVDRDSEFVATTTKTSPVVARRARGSIVEDVDGNLYVDFTCGIGVTNVGHCHPEIVEAIKRQSSELIHFAGTDFYYEIQVTLAERLVQITPGDFPKKVFFTNSGTEGTEAAIKIAKWNTRKPLIIGFINGFHGRTMGSLAITASRPVHRARFSPMMPGVVHIPYAYCYRCAYKLEYPGCGLYCAKILEELYFEAHVPAEDVAALFFEPVQGEGGYIVPPKGWIDEIAAISRRHRILVVDDEVQAGFGRTGRMFAVEHSKTVPDILYSAKAIASGLPMGAVIFDAKLDFDKRGIHSNTFGGNLVACASSLATINLIEKEGLLENANRMGEVLEKRLAEMAEKYPIMGDNRGLGLMWATEYVKDRDTKEFAEKERDQIVELAFKRGLILLPSGKSVIRYIPSLNIAEGELNAGLDVLDSCIRDASGSNEFH